MIPVPLELKDILFPIIVLLDPVTLISLPKIILSICDTLLSIPKTILLPETLFLPTITLLVSKDKRSVDEPLDKTFTTKDDSSLLFVTLLRLEVIVSPVLLTPDEFKNVKAKFWSTPEVNTEILSIANVLLLSVNVTYFIYPEFCISK